MNIAEITTFEEGGAYTHVVELIKGIDAKFLVVCGNTRKSGYEKKGGNTYFHAPCLLSIWDIFFVNRPGSYHLVVEALQKNNVDVVHFHSPLFTFLVGLMRKRQFPLIMTTHYLLDIKANQMTSILYRWFIRWMTRSIAQTVDKIICVNEEYIPIFTEWGIDPAKLIYIPNGVDTKKFSPGQSRIKKTFQGYSLIVYFGRLHYQKNVDMLIRSFPLIKNKMKNVKLVIIGDGTDFQKLKKMSASDSDIIMTGFISDTDLLEYLRAADIVVFPSRGENASFTLLEAMAFQLPVISSNVGTAETLLSDGRGILLQKYTDEEIAEQCLFLLQHPEQRKEMSERARRFVQSHFSWEVISKETETVYHQLVAQRKVRYSVIIPALNEEKNIGRCIREIQRQMTDAEIIVVDGMSTDKTREIAEKLGARVVMEKRKGIAVARNTGVKNARGEIVCFVDADTIPAPFWFAHIIRPFTKPSVVGVGGRASPIDGTFLENIGMWFVFGILSPFLFKLRVPLVTGQNMAFRKNAILSVGGFREVSKLEKIYAEGEDTNMFLRMKTVGKIVHARSSVLVSMRRVRNWGMARFVSFNIRNYLHLLKYGTPIDEEYGPARE